MEINSFVLKVAQQFVEKDIPNVTVDGVFRNLDSWDSLTGMAILAMIDDEFKVTITEDEFKSVKTPRELFDLIKSKK